MLLRTGNGLMACLMLALLSAVAWGGDVQSPERYPLASAALLRQAPQIDGQVEEAEWQGAAVLGPLLTAGEGVSESQRHTVYVGYDAKQVYIAFRIRRPATARQPLTPEQTGHIDSWRGGDFIEFALDLDHDGRDYYAFNLYANGAFGEGKGSPGVDRNWDTPWQQAASLTDDGWQGELAIPFASLGLDAAPAPGTVWGFDFIDNQQTPNTLVSQWAFRGKSWHRLRNLGHLRFAAPDEPAVRYLRFGEIGGQTIGEFELVNSGAADATVQVQVQLLRRKSGADGGPKSFHDHVESGADDDYAEGAAEFEKSTSIPQLIKDGLALYEPVTDGRIEQSIAVPAGQRRGFGLLRQTGTGEFLLRHQVSAADGTMLAATVRVVRIEPPLALTLEPYWLRREALDVVVDLSKVNLGQEATLEVLLHPEADRTQALSRQQLPLTGSMRQAQATLSTAKLEPGSYGVIAVVRDPQGKELARNTAAIVRPPTPPWFDNDLGKSLPQPWTPVKVQAPAVVEVWGRSYDLSTILPRAISSGGDAMLTAPIRLEASAAGQALDWRDIRVQQRSADDLKAVFDVQMQLHDAATLRGTATLEFDGLLWYDLTLTPNSGAVALDGLTLAIDMNPAHAALLDFHRFLHDPLITAKAPVPAKFDEAQNGRLVQTWIPFSPYVWMGDERGGLAFVAEAPVDWMTKQPQSVIRVEPPVQGADAAQMRVRLIDHSVELSRPMRLQFGLQATPIRAMPAEDVVHAVQIGGPMVDAEAYQKIAAAGGRTMIFHGGWKGSKTSEWSGWPGHPSDPQRREELKTAIDQAHAAGLTVSLYTGWGVAVDSDEWRLFGHEMARKPLENSGFGTYRQSAGLTGVYTDFMVWKHAELMRTYGNDGVFWDSAANLPASADIGIGTGWIDEQGRVRPAYPVRGTRELFKRIYTLSHGELKSTGRIVNFGGSIWCINAFCDIFHRGEGKPMHVKKLRDAWNPLEEMRANYDGRKIGVAYMAMNKNFKNLAMKVNQHNAVTLLHGTVCKDNAVFLRYPQKVYYGIDDQPAPLIWQARQWLPLDAKTRWLPYYGNQQAVTLMPSSLLSSAFVSADGQRALIVVSNLDDQPIQGALVRLNLDVLGFPAQATLQAQDALLGEPIAIEGNAIKLDIQAERYRLLKVWRP